MFDALFYTALALGAIAFILLISLRRWLNSEVFSIEPFVWLMMLAGFYELICTKVLAFNSDIWFRSYCFMEFFTIYYFFYRMQGIRYRKFFIASAVVYFIVFAGLLFFWNTLGHMDGDAVVSILETVFVYIMCVLWFKNIFSDAIEPSLLKSPIFYFICGFVLYFSGTLFLFMLGQLLRDNSGIDFNSFWIYNIVFNILLRIFLILGICKGQRKSVRYSG